MGVGKVDRLDNYKYIIQLVDEEEGYDPTGGFLEALNDGGEAPMATRWQQR